VPQRDLDISQAKQLMAAAGFADGFKVKLTTEKFIEIPEYCQIIQQAVRPIGITIDLNVESQDAYYGKAVFGQSDWLVDHGARLAIAACRAPTRAPLTNDGTWTRHFQNKKYVGWVAICRRPRPRLATGGGGKVQTLLLDETPVIPPVSISDRNARAHGSETTAMAHVFLAQAYSTEAPRHRAGTQGGANMIDDSLAQLGGPGDHPRPDYARPARCGRVLYGSRVLALEREQLLCQWICVGRQVAPR
jgi:ABC-type transport system substrate-binding protein